MAYIDLHSDTIYQLWRGRADSLVHNGLDIDIERLKKADCLVQCFALFNNELSPDTFESWMEFYEFYKRVIEEQSDSLMFVENYEDIAMARLTGKCGIMKTVEDSRVIGDDIDKLRDIRKLGVRILGFVWDSETPLAYQNKEDYEYHNRGLKPKGREAVELLNELGIIPDVSHLNRGGTLELAELSKKPVIASHSLSRSVQDHRRNMTDEEIRAIADTGGVIGLNFCPEFLGSDKRVSFENIKRHLDQMVKVGGEGVAAIGTDFDGFGAEYSEYPDISYLPKLYDDMLSAGYSSSFVDGMFFRNALRVFRETF